MHNHASIVSAVLVAKCRMMSREKKSLISFIQSERIQSLLFAVLVAKRFHEVRQTQETTILDRLSVSAISVKAHIGVSLVEGDEHFNSSYITFQMLRCAVSVLLLVSVYPPGTHSFYCLPCTQQLPLSSVSKCHHVLCGAEVAHMILINVFYPVTTHEGIAFQSCVLPPPRNTPMVLTSSRR